MSIGHGLEACYDTLKGDWSAYSAKPVRVSDIVRAAMARDLFAPEGKDAEVPWTLYRDCYSQLIQRDGDEWTIPDMIREEALALHEACVSAKMNVDDTLVKVKVLQGKWASMQRAEADEKAKGQREAEQKARQEALEAKVATDKAQRELVKAEKAGNTETANKAREELLAKQRTEMAAIAEAQEAERNRVRADADAKTKADREQRALESAREREQRRVDRQTQRETKTATARPIEPMQAGLKGMAKAGTAKDIAAMMLELCTGGDSPVEAMEAFLEMAKVHAVLGGKVPSVAHGIRAYFVASTAEEMRKAGKPAA
jgi:hypothetical protein